VRIIIIVIIVIVIVGALERQDLALDLAAALLRSSDEGLLLLQRHLQSLLLLAAARSAATDWDTPAGPGSYFTVYQFETPECSGPPMAHYKHIYVFSQTTLENGFTRNCFGELDSEFNPDQAYSYDPTTASRMPSDPTPMQMYQFRNGALAVFMPHDKNCQEPPFEVLSADSIEYAILTGVNEENGVCYPSSTGGFYHIQNQNVREGSSGGLAPPYFYQTGVGYSRDCSDLPCAKGLVCAACPAGRRLFGAPKDKGPSEHGGHSDCHPSCEYPDRMRARRRATGGGTIKPKPGEKHAHTQTHTKHASTTK